MFFWSFGALPTYIPWTSDSLILDLLGSKGLKCTVDVEGSQRVQLECHYGSRAPQTIYGMIFGT